MELYSRWSEELFGALSKVRGALLSSTQGQRSSVELYLRSEERSSVELLERSEELYRALLKVNRSSMELYLRYDELDGALSKVRGALESSLSVLRGLLNVFRGLAVFNALLGGVTDF